MTYYFQIANGVAFWASVGTFYLLLMTFKDLFNNMRIDDRYNFFMMGASFFLLTYFTISIWYLLALILIIIILNIYLKKFKVLGGADISAFTWLFYGYAIISYKTLLLFVAVLICFTGMYYVVRKVMKISEKVPTPYFPVILASFILTNIIWGLY